MNTLTKRYISRCNGFCLKGNVEEGIKDVLIQNSISEQDGGENHKYTENTA